MNGWAAMVKARRESGMTVREWCETNGITQSVYYYRLNQLRKAALNEVSDAVERETPFFQIRKQEPSPGVSVRIRRGDTVIEIDNQASESLLNFLKEVLTDAV